MAADRTAMDWSSVHNAESTSENDYCTVALTDVPCSSLVTVVNTVAYICCCIHLHIQWDFVFVSFQSVNLWVFFKPAFHSSLLVDWSRTVTVCLMSSELWVILGCRKIYHGTIFVATYLFAISPCKERLTESPKILHLLPLSRKCESTDVHVTWC